MFRLARVGIATAFLVLFLLDFAALDDITTATPATQFGSCEIGPRKERS